MSKNSITLTQQEKEILSFYLKSKMYPDAYLYAQQIVYNKGGDEGTRKWLGTAADINKGPDSFYETVAKSTPAAYKINLKKY